MRRTTEDKPTLFSQLEDLDVADDVALFSRTHQHMQEKTSRLNINCKASRSEDQREENRADGAEHPKPLTKYK